MPSQAGADIDRCGPLTLELDFRTRKHRLIERYACSIDLEVVGAEAPPTFAGTAVCRVEAPRLERTTTTEETEDYHVTLSRDHVEFDVTGSLDDQKVFLDHLQWVPRAPLPYHVHAVSGRDSEFSDGSEEDRDLDADFFFPTRLRGGFQAGRFLVDTQEVVEGACGDDRLCARPSFVYFATYGSQDRTESEKGLVTARGCVAWSDHKGGASNPPRPPERSIPLPVWIALLGYLALALRRTLTDPDSSPMIGLFATVIGAVEPVGALGLRRIAEQAKLGGFAGAALAEALELGRLYWQSTRAGEPTVRTAGRLTLSVVMDAGAFLAGAALAELAIGAALGGAAAVGPVAAGTVAVAGGALLSYGLSTVLGAAKERLSVMLFGTDL